MSTDTTTVVVVPGNDTSDVRVGSEKTVVVGTGTVGPQGIPGAAAGTFVFTQDSPSALWTIAHELGAFPNVTVVDTLSRQVEADIVYVDANTVTAGFANPATGQAFLS